MTGLERGRLTTEAVRVVAQLVTHRVVQADRLLTRSGLNATVLFGEGLYRRVLTIDVLGGLQVDMHGNAPLSPPV